MKLNSNVFFGAVSAFWQDMPPRGLDVRPLPSLQEKLEILQYLLNDLELVAYYHQNRLYQDQEVVNYEPAQRKLERNSEIIDKYRDGIPVAKIAILYEVSVQRGSSPKFSVKTERHEDSSTDFGI